MCKYLQDSTFSYSGHISSSRVAINQLLSHVQLFATPWTAGHQDSLSFTISKSLLKLMSIESVMLSSHLIFCHPLLLLSSIFPSIGSFPRSWLFATGGQSIGASASASVLPMNTQCWFPLELTVLISLLLKGLKSLLQHNSKTSILWCSALWSNIHIWLLRKSQFWLYECQQSDVFVFFFLSLKKIFLLLFFLLYNIVLVFSTVSMFVIAFLPRRKCILISWSGVMRQVTFMTQKWSFSLNIPPKFDMLLDGVF